MKYKVSNPACIQHAPESRHLRQKNIIPYAVGDRYTNVSFLINYRSEISRTSPVFNMQFPTSSHNLCLSLSLSGWRIYESHQSSLHELHMRFNGRGVSRPLTLSCLVLWRSSFTIGGGHFLPVKATSVVVIVTSSNQRIAGH